MSMVISKPAFKIMATIYLTVVCLVVFYIISSLFIDYPFSPYEGLPDGRTSPMVISGPEHPPMPDTIVR